MFMKRFSGEGVKVGPGMPVKGWGVRWGFS
jgi:hypothetical protein